MSTLALLQAGQLVTLGGPAPRRGRDLRELRIVEDGAMLIRDGVIAAIGHTAEINEQAAGARIIDAGGRVVLPGFVDAHTHPVFAGTRAAEFELRAGGATYEEIAARGGGVQSTVRSTRAADEEQLFNDALRRVEWFLQCGTTTIEAKSGYGLDVADEIKLLRVIHRLNGETPLELVPTFLGAHAVPPDMSRADYIRLVIEEMLPQVTTEHLAENCDIFVERGYFEPDDARRILTAAKQHGLKLRMHVDQLTDSGGAALAAELGATTADHLEQSGPEGIAALAAASVQPVLLPASVHALGKIRYPRAREMIESGLPVVLATDFNPGSSPTPCVPMVISLAVTHMGMTFAEAISAATINAACSLGRAETIGSLEPGKLANFAVYDCADYREIGYYFGLPLTHSVFIRGEQVFGA